MSDPLTWIRAVHFAATLALAGAVIFGAAIAGPALRVPPGEASGLPCPPFASGLERSCDCRGLGRSVAGAARRPDERTHADASFLRRHRVDRPHPHHVRARFADTACPGGLACLGLVAAFARARRSLTLGGGGGPGRRVCRCPRPFRPCRGDCRLARHRPSRGRRCCISSRRRHGSAACCRSYCCSRPPDVEIFRLRSRVTPRCDSRCSA